MSLIFWAAMALIAGLGLVFVEIFIPSGGILGFLAFASLATSIVLAFMYDPLVGIGFVGIIVVMLPIIIAFALKWLPHTPIGKRVMLAAPTSEDVLPDDKTYGNLSQLVGQVGKAKSMMLPSGAVMISGRTIDAVSEGVPIDPGQLVRIIQVRGNRVVVRPVETDEILDDSLPPVPETSQPVDSLGANPFEDPIP